MSPRPGRAPGTCGAPGCDAETFDARCPEHARGRRRDDRPSSDARGYDRAWSRGPRAAVLARDPWCMVCGLEPSSVADHHPLERRDLVAAGVPDPDAPEFLRGVCASCHGRRGGQRRAELRRRGRGP